MLALYRSGARRRRSRRSPPARRQARRRARASSRATPLRALHQRILEQDPVARCAGADDGRRRRVARRGRRRRHRRRRPWPPWSRSPLVAPCSSPSPATATRRRARGARQLARPARRARAAACRRRSTWAGRRPASPSARARPGCSTPTTRRSRASTSARTRSRRSAPAASPPTSRPGAGALWVGNGKRTRAQFIGPVATSVVARRPEHHRGARRPYRCPEARGFTSNLQQDHIAVDAGRASGRSIRTRASRASTRATDEVVGGRSAGSTPAPWRRATRACGRSASTRRSPASIPRRRRSTSRSASPPTR